MFSSFRLPIICFFGFALTVSISAQGVNQNPVINSSPTTSIDDNVLYRYEISATDPDGDLMRYSSSALPDWLSFCQYCEGTVSTLAGFLAGYNDGQGSAALFASPSGLAIGPDNNLYVADLANHRIRKVTPSGEVTTFAGSTAGSVDGPLNEALFNYPSYIAFGPDGAMYVLELSRSVIRKISTEGVVSTFAGNGNMKWQEGVGTGASFPNPTSLVVTPDGEIFFVAGGDIGKISIDREVEIFLTDGKQGVQNFEGLARNLTLDKDGSLLFSEGSIIKRASPEGVVTTIAGSGKNTTLDGPVLESGFSEITGLTADPIGNIFVSEPSGLLRQVTPEGEVRTIAGGATDFPPTDGIGSVANLQGAKSPIVDNHGNLYLITLDMLRRVTFPYALLVGDPQNQAGTYPISIMARDGNGGETIQEFDLKVDDVSAPTLQKIERTSTLLANNPVSQVGFKLTFSEAVNNLDVTDLALKEGGATGTISEVLATGNDQVYEVSIAVTQASGELDLDLSINQNIQDKSGKDLVQLMPVLAEETYDFSNQAPQLTTTQPDPVVAGQQIEILLKTADQESHNVTISPISLPSWLRIQPPQVTTVIGKPGVSGKTDGREEGLITEPTGLTRDDSGNLYIVGDNLIRKVSQDGYISTLAGSEAGDRDGQGAEAEFNEASFITYAQGFLYVTDLRNHKIKKVSLMGEVTTFAGSSQGGDDGDLSVATFDSPRSVRYFDSKFYVIDKNGIRVIDGNEVTTLPLVDEQSNPFLFNNIIAFAIDSSGEIYVADLDSKQIHKVSNDFVVTIVTGSTEGDQDGNSDDARFGTIQSLEFDGRGNLYIGDVTNRKVKRLDRQGKVTSIAGVKYGFQDGNGETAEFRGVNDIYFHPHDYLLISDWPNQVIRKVDLHPSLVGTVPASVSAGQARARIKLTDVLGASRNHDLILDIQPATMPVFTSAASATFDEGKLSAAYHAQVENGSNVAFSLRESPDANSFSINHETGQIFFKNTPNFEGPEDADSDNVYELVVLADNGTFCAEHEIEINVTGISDETPFFTSNPVTEVRDDEAYDYQLAGLDPDGEQIFFRKQSGPAWLFVRQKPGKEVSTLAGNWTSQSIDGTGEEASFVSPVSLAYGPEGDLYVADNGAHNIRRITPDGVVSTFAGSGLEGSSDGNANEASFNHMVALTVDDSGNVYVVGSGQKVRKITAAGVVTTLAGSGQRGYADGTGSEAMFNNPSGIAVDQGGNLIVVDQSNNRIRKVTPDGIVTTLAGSGAAAFADGTGMSASFNLPRGITIDNFGDFYVADQNNHRIRKVTANGVVTTVAGSGTAGYQDGSGSQAAFNLPIAVAVDALGNLYVTDFLNYRIRRIDSRGDVTTWAGSGESGYQTGPAEDARFDALTGLSLDHSGNLAIADGANRRVMLMEGAYFLEGYPNNQVGQHAVSLQVYDQSGSASDQAFKLTVLDAAFPRFTSGVFEELEENSAGVFYTASVDDNAGVTFSLGNEKDEALFSIDASTGELNFILTPDFENPTDGNDDNIYNLSIIAAKGENETTHEFAVGILNQNEHAPTFVSAPVEEVDDDVDYQYNIQVADEDGGRPVISASQLPDWLTLDPGSLIVSNLAGSGNPAVINGTGTAASFSYASGIVLDAAGNVYVADFDGHVVRKITPSGEVTTFAGSGSYGNTNGAANVASFQEPSGLTIDKSGNIYVADFGSGGIRKITPGGEVTTFTGLTTQRGYKDGPADEAKFASPIEITIDEAGNLYVADYTNHVIRKVDTNGTVSTLAGNGEAGFQDGLGSAARFNYPSDMVVDADGNVYVADGGNHAIRKITPEGLVSTIAGSGNRSYADGQGVSAEFSSPTGIDFDVDGNLLVADIGNRVIRKVTLEGLVTTLVGDRQSKEEDGPAAEASFKSTLDVISDGNGGMFVSTGSGNTLRKVGLTDPSLTGSPVGLSGSFNVGLKAKDKGDLEVTQDFTITINDVTTPAITSTASVQFQEGSSLAAYQVKATDAAEISYSLGTGNDESLFEISSSSGLVFFKNDPDFENPQDANTDNTYVIEAIVSDGVNEVRLEVSIEVTDLAEGALEFTSSPITEVERSDFYQYIIEANNPETGEVEITAESLPEWLDLKKTGQVTSIPGKGYYIAEDGQGNFYTADDTRIWKIDNEGVITLLAGADERDYIDDTGSAARFGEIMGIAYGPDDNLYVSDARYQTIRKVSLSGEVTTFAGIPSTSTVEQVNGALGQATFLKPAGLVFDNKGNLFVADSRSNTIRKISTEGLVSTYAGRLVPEFVDRGNGLTLSGYKGGYVDGDASNARFHFPVQLAFDSKGGLYVTDRFNNLVRKISAEGQVSTVAGSGKDASIDGVGTEASFADPYGITLDDKDRIYVADLRLRMIENDGEVITLAGNNLTHSIDGIGQKAGFNARFSLLFGSDKYIYLPEDSDNRIRKIDLLEVLEGNPFHHVGSHDVELKAASDDNATTTQSFTLTVTDNDQPEFLEVLRINPAEEKVRTDYVEFLVNFNEPVLNLDAGDFGFDQSQLLGEIDQVLQLNDSSFRLRVANIRGFGELSLGLVETNDITDANGLSIRSLVAGTAESYIITANEAPEFLSEPTQEVSDQETYNYPVLLNDKNENSLELVPISIPTWLTLDTAEYHFANFAGSESRDSEDGVGEDASFGSPNGISADRLGNLYVANSSGNSVRKISKNAEVSSPFPLIIRFTPTPSGSGGTSSSMNPNDLLVDEVGNIFITTGRFGTIEKMDPRGNRITLAGSEAGFADGNGSEARFNSPYGMALDPEGNIIVADAGNSAIRKVTPTGEVTTIAGGTHGFADGDASVAMFRNPVDVAVDAEGNIFIADQGNRRIRKIDLEGNVSTIAGTGKFTGSDKSAGPALDVEFGAVQSIMFDHHGNLFIADIGAKVISVMRRNGMIDLLEIINPVSGEPETVATAHMTFAPNGNIYAIIEGRIVEIQPVSRLVGNARGQKGKHQVSLKATDQWGTETYQNFTINVKDNTAPVLERVERMNPTSQEIGLSTVSFKLTFTDEVKNLDLTDFSTGDSEVTGLVTSICTLSGMHEYEVTLSGLSGEGSLGLTLVEGSDITDLAGNALELPVMPVISETYTRVNTAPVFISQAVSTPIREDFYSYSIQVSDEDCDQLNITAPVLPDWLSLVTKARVTTVAGTGSFGNNNGQGTEAGFANPQDVAVDSHGNVYVADLPSQVIRKITPSGEVTNYAGGLHQVGLVDGALDEARFNSPSKLVIDSKDNLYVADQRNFAIRKITPEGVVSTIAGGTEGFQDGTGSEAKFIGPRNMAVDAQDNIYLIDRSNDDLQEVYLRKIDSETFEVSTIAGGESNYLDGELAQARFVNPSSLAIDDSGNIFITEYWDHTIRKITPSGKVSTVAGSGSGGYTDAVGTSAEFNSPVSLAFDNFGNLLIGDQGNSRIRMMSKDGTVTTLAGSGQFELKDGIGAEASFYSPFGLAVDKANNLFVADVQNYAIRKVTYGTFLEGNPADAPITENVTLQVEDGRSGQVQQVFTINTDISAPVFTSPTSVSVNENTTTSFYTVEATDKRTVSFALGTNVDESSFEIDASSGEIKFKSTPDFENPQDQDQSNNYDVEIIASDGFLESSMLLEVTVTDISDLHPGFITQPVIEIPYTEEYTYRPQVIDRDGDQVTLTATLPDWLELSNVTEAGVTTFAGSTLSTFASGPANYSSFSRPSGIVIDAGSNVYVADTDHHMIRKIRADGFVEVLAGSGNAGYVDGTRMDASFNRPIDLVQADNGDLYIADQANFLIRKVTLDGVVTTVAGTGVSGGADGPASTASFGTVTAIDIDSQGNLLVLDKSNKAVRKITPQGDVTTLSLFGESLLSPIGIAVGSDDVIYVADEGSLSIKVIATNGQVSVLAGSGTRGNDDGQGTSASFASIVHLDIDASGNLYVIQFALNAAVRKIDPQGNVTTLLGAEGSAPVNTLDLGGFLPFGLALAAEDEILISEWSSGRIVKLEVDQNVSVYAGGFANVPTDGFRTESTFNAPSDAAYDSHGNLYIVDSENHRIRIVTPQGQVMSFAGSGQAQTIDGPALTASFNSPEGIVVDSNGNIFVSERSGRVIRKITPDGTVSTFAGSGARGFANGTGTNAEFASPGDMIIDDEDNIFLVDIVNNRIRKITPAAEVTTIAGNGEFAYADGPAESASFFQPKGLAWDNDGNILVADGNNNRIRRISSDGIVSTVAGSGEASNSDGMGLAATFDDPKDLVVDRTGNIYVVSGSTIRLIYLNGEVVTFAGNDTEALKEGDGLASSFNKPQGILFDPHGNLLVVDSDNHRIRKISIPGATVTGNPMDRLGEHEVTLVAEDEGGNRIEQSYTLEVVDRVRPEFVSESEVSFNENGTGVAYIAMADDVSTVTFGLFGGGIDNALFTINEETGELSFVNSPDFEDPEDDDSDNQYEVWISALDAYLNSSILQLTVLVKDIEEIPPTLSITTTETGPTNESPLTFSITTSEEVTGFTQEDLVVHNATITDFSGSQASYSLTLVPLEDGEITINIPANVMTDLAGNSNLAADEFSIESDRTAPVVTFASEAESPTNEDLIEVSITLSEEVTALSASNINVENGDIISLEGADLSYTLTVSPTADGVVMVSTAADITDPAGNVAEQKSLEVVSDRTNPVASINTAAADLVNSSFSVTVEYDEPVEGFVLDDVQVTNGQTSGFTPIIAGQKWSLTVIPEEDGEVELSLPANVAADEAGNGNTGAELKLTFDGTAPVVSSITPKSDNPLIANSAEFRVVFSEAVTGFDLSDLGLVLTGTATASLESITPIDGTTYDVTMIDVSGEGTLALTLDDDDSIIDAAGNTLAGSGTNDGSFTGEAYQTNFSPTGISISNSNIDENNETNAVIGAFTVVDPDEGDEHILSLVSGTGSDDNASFEITDNQLIAISSFDFETKSEYSVRVRATDNYDSAIEVIFVIEVNDVAEPAISLAGDLDFGSVDIQTTSQLDFSIVNEGDVPLEVSALTFPAGFSGNFSGGNIPVGSSETVTVTFSPLENITYSGQIEVSSNGGNMSIDVSGTGQLVTSIEEDSIEAEEVNLYPNPASHIVQIDLTAFNGRPINIHLTDASGKSRLSISNVRETVLELDVSDYPQGLFLVRLTDGEQEVVKRLLIKR